MPWFKVDDSFESHPKVKSIPPARRIKAIGLWTLAGSWSARQLTDGFIPNYMLSELAATKREATTLVEVGLWSVEGEGYRFKDWCDWQPTRVKVEAERDAAKQRMKAARERKRGASSGDVRANESVSPPNGSGEVRSTPRSVTPTRPDPTRPDPTKREDIEPDGPMAPSAGLSLVDDDRPDVDRICEHLADLVCLNGSKRPAITRSWRDSARLMLDNDGRTESEIHGAIAWSQGHEFWRANVLSMPKLRQKFDQLRLQAQRDRPGSKPSNMDNHKALVEQLAAEEHGLPFGQIGGAS